MCSVDGSDAADKVLARMLRWTVDFLQQTPVTPDDIALETLTDNILSVVLKHMRVGWPLTPDNFGLEVRHYYSRRREFTVVKGCILLSGFQIVIPTKLRPRMIEALNALHCALPRLRAWANALFWWPTLDEDITKAAEKCHICLEIYQSDVVSPSPSERPVVPGPKDRLWKSMYVDYGNFDEDRRILVAVDSLTEWVEAWWTAMPSTRTILEYLVPIFSQHGLCRTLFCGHQLAFQSPNFKDYFEFFGVRLIYPASNQHILRLKGPAESALNQLKQLMADCKTSTSIDKLPQALFAIRRRASGDGRTPAQRLRELERQKSNSTPAKLSLEPVTVNNSQERLASKKMQMPPPVKRRDTQRSLNFEDSPKSDDENEEILEVRKNPEERIKFRLKIPKEKHKFKRNIDAVNAKKGDVSNVLPKENSKQMSDDDIVEMPIRKVKKKKLGFSKFQAGKKSYKARPLYKKFFVKE